MLPISIVNKSRPQVITRILKAISKVWSVGYKALPKELPSPTITHDQMIGDTSGLSFYHIKLHSDIKHIYYGNKTWTKGLMEYVHAIHMHTKWRRLAYIFWVTSTLPHCHYTPKEWKRDLVHRIGVCHEGYSKRVNPKAVIGIRANCCRYGARWVDDTGTLCPSHWRLRPIWNRNGAAHISIRAIAHEFTLFVYAGLHSLHSE